MKISMRSIAPLLILVATSCSNPLRQRAPGPAPAPLSTLSLKGNKRANAEKELLTRSQDIEKDASYADLKKSLDKHQKDLNAALLASQGVGRAHYMLGLKFMDYKMYDAALDSFKESMKFYPAGASLYYYAGISAAQMAALQPSDREKTAYYDLAVGYQRVALNLDPTHSDARLALAVLYAYYLNDTAKAAPLARKYAADRPNDADGQLINAYIAAKEGNMSTAAEYYGKAANLIKDPARKKQVLDSRAEALSGRDE